MPADRPDDDFDTLVSVVVVLARYRLGLERQPKVDAALVGLVRDLGASLYRLGGQPLLDRAVLCVGRQVGGVAANAVRRIFAGIGSPS